MNPTISLSPVRLVPNVNTFPNFLSRWVAAHNPIIYGIQRQDYQIKNIVEEKIYSFSTLLFTTHLVELNEPIVLPDVLTVGETIYLKSGNYALLCRLGTVVDATHFYVVKLVGGTFPNKGNSTGGFINLTDARSNYHFDLDILGVDYATNAYYVLGSTSIFPDTTGLAKINVQEWVKKLITYENTFDYVSVNKKDSNHSGQFNIRFTPQWIDNDDNTLVGTLISDSQRMFFANAARQLLAGNGQNMGDDFVPAAGTTQQLTRKAHWLSGFEKPTVFRDYPFALSFIYSDNIAPYTCFRNWLPLDVNGVSQGAQARVALAGSEALFINRCVMPTIALNTEFVDVWLELTANIGIETGRLEENNFTTYADDHTTDYWALESIAAPPTAPEEDTITV